MCCVCTSKYYSSSFFFFFCVVNFFYWARQKQNKRKTEFFFAWLTSCALDKTKTKQEKNKGSSPGVTSVTVDCCVMAWSDKGLRVSLIFCVPNYFTYNLLHFVVIDFVGFGCLRRDVFIIPGTVPYNTF